MADMSKGVLPGSKEVPPHLLEFSDDEPPRKRTRARHRMSQEARDKAFSPAKQDQDVTVMESDDATTAPRSTESLEPPSDEGFAQSNSKRQRTVKRRPWVDELETNLGEGWDFKNITSRGRPSKPRD